VSLGNATNTQLLSIQVPNLLSWMSYNYKAVAANDSVRSEGAQASFTLPGPSVTTPSVSGLSGVTLPQGAATSLWFTVSSSPWTSRAAGNNPVLLPNGALTVGGSGGNATSMSCLLPTSPAPPK